jgi:superfamily II DNA or RNA helicase
MEGAQFSQLYKNYQKMIHGQTLEPGARIWSGVYEFMTKTNSLPIGLLKEFRDWCELNKVVIEYRGYRAVLKPKVYPVKDDFLAGITLREEQVDAINVALSTGLGICKLPTGAGKTEIIVGVLKAYDSPRSLILVNKIYLAQQIRDRLALRGIPKEDIGIIYGTEKEYEGKKFIVSTIQSIVNFPEIYKNAEVIIVDECKHQAAKTYCDVFRKSNAVVRLGFDATPFTEDNRCTDFMIKKFLGDIIYEVPTRRLIDKGVLVEPRIKMIKMSCDYELGDKGMDYSKAYDKFVVDNKQRNKMIVELAARHSGRVLILINKIKHGRTLEKLLPNALFLHGEIDSQERYDQVQEFIASTDKFDLIGSTIFDEGVDFPKGIDALIVASAGKGFRKTIQRIGRALRNNGKGFVDVYDFYDYGNSYLEEHSKTRYEIYIRENFQCNLF